MQRPRHPPDEGHRMIELRLLGSPDLTGVDTPAAAALLGQPKRLAVLIYLALATPRGWQRRDRLVGMLWPELDQERARTALRKTVLVLRRTLGEPAIVSRGDEEIAVAPGTLWCDAVEADTAFDAGHYARVLELYRRGDLLPSFFVPSAAGFEDWLDRERSALRDRAAAAAWSLASFYKEDEQYTVAARFARQATQLAPADERMLRRVMTLLEQVGDRAGAAYVYEDFVRRLRRDYGVEPARETLALLDRIRDPG
jgi:DNA-binding SARP family transcriptional activator